VQLVGLARYQA